ncbi:MAG: Ig-like domain repeat protein [Candidatus Helarchaeota archaeon]
MRKKWVVLIILSFLVQILFIFNLFPYYSKTIDFNKFYLQNNVKSINSKTQPAILFVYTDSIADWSAGITDALDNLGLTYDKLTTAPTYNTLKNYKVVIWSTGYYDPNSYTYEVRLEQYLNNGGNLLLTSNNWIYYSSFNGNITFITQYLGVNNYNPASLSFPTYDNLVGNSSNPIGKGLSFDQTSVSAFAQWMQPKSFASMVFYDSDNASDPINATAINYNNVAGGYKTVFFCMPLEHCSDLTTRTTILNRTLQWFMPNNKAPTLADGQVTPVSGNSAQLFTFKVNYTDFDNNSPIYVNITINNTYIYEMQKENPNDNDYVDGVIFNFSTYLSAGSYEYYFNASDWYFKASSSVYTGPTVTSINLNPPNLGNGRVYPTTGSNITTFKFKVNYSDPDNNEPSYVNVTIDSQVCTMAKQNPMDINYIDGATYEYSTTLTVGNHYYYFNASDGVNSVGIPTSGNFSGPQVSVYVPATSLLFDGLSYNWTGIIMSTPWSGTEYYQYLGGNSFRCNETMDLGGPIEYRRTVDNRSRLITSTTGFWPLNSHDWLWIFNNVSLGDKVMISTYSGDKEFNVSGETTRNALGLTFNVWILDNPDGEIAYYDKLSGMLIEGTFIYFAPSTYSIKVSETNAIFSPNFEIISPKNQTYYFSDVPIIVQNSTDIDQIWYRNSTDGISWSQNYTTTNNGTHYTNSSYVNWGDGNYIIQVFGNNSQGLETEKKEYFTVLTYGPYVILENPQNATYLHRTVNVILSNYSNVDRAWFRYYSGGSWSANFSLEYNNTHFVNNSISWNDGIYHLQVFANDSTTEIALREEWFVIAATFPLNLSHNLAWDERPRIALDTFGNAHIVWYGNETGEFNIYYDTNENGHFGNKVQLTDSTNQMWADIAVDSSNIVHLVWMDMSDMLNIVIKYTNNSGGQFNPPISLTGPPLGLFAINMYPSIAVDEQGFAHIAWIAPENIFADYEIFYSNNTGGSFGTPVNVSRDNENDASPPAIAVDKNRIVHILYVNNQTGNYQVYYKNNSLGDFSMNPINISRNNAHNQLPDIAVDSNNKVHIVWANNKTGDFEIYYVNNSLTDFTSNPLNISQDSLRNDMDPTISLDNLTNPNSIFITWCKNDSNNFEIYESDNVLGSFNQPSNISKSYTMDGLPDISVDPNSRFAHITWEGNGSDFDIYYNFFSYRALELKSPLNFTYNYNRIPIIVENKSYIDQVWYRNNTGMGWSDNFTLVSNGTYFLNDTMLIWQDGNYHLQVFGNDSSGSIFTVEEYLQVDLTPPSGNQDIQTRSPQRNDGLGRVWINGTAHDITSGVSNILIQSNNVTGGATWTVNQGTNTNWAFYNTSYIPDNNFGEVYQIIINITDKAGNSNLTYCYIFIDNSPPELLNQDFITYYTNYQIGPDVWVNGSAADKGAGLLSVEIVNSNTSCVWTENLNTNQSWAFRNNSIINSDGVYEIIVNATDILGNSNLTKCLIRVEVMPPTGFAGNYLLNPQNGTIVGPALYIWINGTAFDAGSGVNNVSIYPNEGNSSAIWSNNMNTNESWAFYNTSPVIDSGCGEVYEIKINITDNAGNCFNLTIYFRVDTTQPSGLLNLCDLNLTTTDNIINLNWTPSIDNSKVRYQIWRRTIPSGQWQLINTTNFDECQYNDTVLSDGIYEYKLRPIDEAGNYGNFSNSIFVTVNTKSEAPVFFILPSENDWTWLIILIIGITAGIAVTAIVLYKKRKTETQFSPKSRHKKIQDENEIVPLFDALVKSRPSTAKPSLLAQPKIESEVPRPEITEKKPDIEIKKDKEYVYYYLCPNCNQVFVANMMADFNCTKCNIQLRLNKRMLKTPTESRSEFRETQEFVYHCKHCDSYFKVPIKGQYNCPKCNMPLREYTGEK